VIARDGVEGRRLFERGDWVRTKLSGGEVNWIAVRECVGGHVVDPERAFHAGASESENLGAGSASDEYSSVVDTSGSERSFPNLALAAGLSLVAHLLPRLLQIILLGLLGPSLAAKLPLYLLQVLPFSLRIALIRRVRTTERAEQEYPKQERQNNTLHKTSQVRR
jgi:hypothetical protein